MIGDFYGNNAGVKVKPSAPTRIKLARMRLIDTINAAEKNLENARAAYVAAETTLNEATSDAAFARSELQSFDERHSEHL